MRGDNSKADLVKVSVFTVFAVFIGAVIVGTLQDQVPGQTVAYKAVFSDSSGMRVGDKVRVAGVSVGKITAIELKEGAAEVDFYVQESQKLRENTLLKVRYENLLGQRFLGLTAGPGASTEVAPGATIPMTRTTPAIDLTAVFNGFKPLFEALKPEEINKLALSIIKVLQGEGGTIYSLMEHSADITERLANRDQAIGRVVDNLNVVVATAATHKEEIKRLITATKSMVSGLAQNRQQIADSIDAVVELADVTESLLTDAGPLLKADLPRLARLTKILADHQKAFDASLKAYPKTLGVFNRALGYGSWANIYICTLSLSVGGVGPVPIDAGTHSSVCEVTQ